MVRNHQAKGRVPQCSSCAEVVASWLGIDESTRGEPLSGQNVALVEKHLQYCLANHAVYRAGSFLPKRLIDLGRDGATHPRLVLTHQEIENQAFPAETVLYAALSYCWGPPADAVTQLKTEVHTLDSRLQEIPEAEMSAVMRDAVAVCRALKIRFLWIDSVCIVQDDRSDWEAESQQMGSIYRHSLLTICAPASHSCHQGFLDSGNDKIDVPFQSRIETSIVGSYTIEGQGLESGMSMLHPNNRSPYNIDIRVSSWATRGWVFQERKLSPRKIVFGRSMFHLVCAHECISQNGLVLRSPVTETLVRVFQALELGIFNDEEVHMAWAEIASEYAGLTLGQPLDRLPAISGLAKVFAESVGLSEDLYVAGLWKPHLLKGYGLLWQREAVCSRQELLNQFRRAQNFIAPTWTWANQAKSFKPGYLHYDLTGSPTRIHSRAEFRKMDIQTARAGLNAFGSITSGTIRMTGRLKTYASLRMSNQYSSTHARRVFEGGNRIADCVLDWVVHRDGEEQGGLLLLPLLSTCPGAAPGLLIYDELKGYDMLVQGDNDRQVVPSSDPYTFSATMDITVLRRITTDSGQEDIESICRCSTAYADQEQADRDVFGIVLYPSDTSGQYWRVGVFFSEALETGGLALFRDMPYQEFDIV